MDISGRSLEVFPIDALTGLLCFVLCKVPRLHLCGFAMTGCQCYFFLAMKVLELIEDVH
jgi:hypothetical protein